MLWAIQSLKICSIKNSNVKVTALVIKGKNNQNLKITFSIDH